MKNTIPLIVAVLLGVAAVFAVSKMMKTSEKPPEKYKQVVIVTGDISEGELIPESRVGTKWVPENAVPRNAIDASNVAFVYNQKAVHAIMKGDYVQYPDLELDQSKSRALGDGQWGVPVKFADITLLRMLQPGDDIAIVGSFTYKESLKVGKNVDQARQDVLRKVTTVIYPCVTVLGISGNAVLLSMPPQQAVALTAIQEKASLYPILRKKTDEKATSRLDGGKFEESALRDMLNGVESISIPFEQLK